MGGSRLHKVKGPEGWLLGRFGISAAVLCCVLALTFILRAETNEEPVKVDDVIEKPQVETSSTTSGDGGPIPIPTVPIPTAPLPTAPLPTAPLPTAPLPTTPAPVATPTAPAEVKPSLSLDDSKTNDFSNIEKLIEQIETARQKMIQGLKVDYGDDIFDDMFTRDINGIKVRVGRLTFVSPNGYALSWNRFLNKMMRKLLQVMLHQQQPKNSAESSASNRIRFVWATGGHSSTAGHGNYYDESYTAVLEKTVSSVFNAAGMDFVGRNYAMGGTDSAPETALCIQSIFGATDPDVLIWDHGMTDGGSTEKLILYFYRGSLSRNRPALIANHLGDRNYKSRCSAVKELEDRGLAAFCSKESVYEEIQAAVPDSLGKTQEEIEQMPPFVRNFKCGNLIEAGDPYCGAQKYNETYCTQRKFKASWHQGWKWHAIQGNVAALFLVELLEDAAKKIQSKAKDPQELYNELQQEEDAEYNAFLTADLPADYANRIVSERGDIDLRHVFLQPCFCHTAKVPAEIRHKGILTEGPPGDMFNYTSGISQHDADSLPNDSEFMLLVRDDSTRQPCPVHLNIDHKDFFYVHARDGWKKLVLPNDAEIAEYGTGAPLVGLIAVCFHLCPWGKCPPGNILGSDVEEGKGEIQVNGIPVVGLTKADKCEFLRGDQGHYWPAPNETKYEIRFRASEPNTFIRIATIVIF